MTVTAATNPAVDPAPSPPTEPTLGEQAPRLLAHVAGFVAHRTIAIGLRSGLIRALADAAGPVAADELAERLGLDPFYVAVWCRSAYAGGVCERGTDEDAASLGGSYRLAPHLATLLLDAEHPAYAGGVFTVLEQPEVFDRFARCLADGERLWWDACGPEWIAGVADTGRPFYARLIPDALAQVPGLGARLAAGCRVVDSACGCGAGLVRLARTYPECRIVGVDGDAHSLAQAERALAAAGVTQRCALVHSPLEEFALDTPATCVINNISLHECRDVDRVVDNVRAALQPGGWFVISDFPFPDSAEGLRSVPGQLMAGIQFFEAQLDDQLLPRAAYDDVLLRHGFGEIGNLPINATHAITWGRAPG